MKRHAARRGLSVKRANDAAGQVDDIGRFSLEFQSARLGERERAKILDEARQQMRFSEHLTELPLVARIHTVDQPFELALDDRQRSSELVRHIGHQIAADTIVILQPACHRVERPRETANRDWTTFCNARRVITARHAVSRIHERPDRQSHASREREDDGRTNSGTDDSADG